MLCFIESLIKKFGFFYFFNTKALLRYFGEESTFSPQPAVVREGLDVFQYYKAYFDLNPENVSGTREFI